MSFGWDFKPRFHVSLLYTGHVKEPEGSFKQEANVASNRSPGFKSTEIERNDIKDWGAEGEGWRGAF